MRKGWGGRHETFVTVQLVEWLTCWLAVFCHCWKVPSILTWFRTVLRRRWQRLIWMHQKSTNIDSLLLYDCVDLLFFLVGSKYSKKNISAINPSPADVQQPPNNRPKDRCCRIEKNGRHSIEYIETLLASKMREFQLERGWELNKQGCTAAA